MYVLLNAGSNIGLYWTHVPVANEVLGEKIRIGIGRAR